MMKSIPMAIAITILSFSAGMSPARQQDWRLGAQAYTFRHFTLFETLDKLAALDVAYVEAYSGQTIGGGIEGKTHFTMPAATRAKIKAKLAETGVTLFAYGVVNGRDEAEWKQLFEFAREMGIETITSEPNPDQLDYIETMANAYGINVAIHNHPTPSRYADPAVAMAACKNRSRRIGVCADTGHWVRSGYDPVAALGLTGSRLIHLHIKDVATAERSAHDVPWGSGIGRMDQQIAMMKAKGFSGGVSIEYEKHSDKLMDDVAKCVSFFTRMAAAVNPPETMVDDIATVLAHVPSASCGRWDDQIGVTAPAGSFVPTKVPTANAAEGAGGDHDTPCTLKVKGATVHAIGKGYDGEWADKLFDDNPKTKWCIRHATVWVEYRCADDKPLTVTSYSVTSANDGPGRDPKAWTLLGSSDGKTWQTVDAQKDVSFAQRFECKTFKVATPAAYTRYKLQVSKNNGDFRTQFAELKLMP